MFALKQNETNSQKHHYTNMSIKQIKKEFNDKNLLLAALSKSVCPEDFYEDYFGSDFYRDPHVVIFENAADGKKMRVVQDMWEAISSSHYFDDMYMYQARYFNDFANAKSMRTLYGLVVDLDDVAPSDINILLDTECYGIGLPTYIVNSGRGIHLVYVFSKSVETKDLSKKILNKMNRALAISLKNDQCRYHVDVAASNIHHAYRVAGGLTKAGQVSQVFRTGEKYLAEDLAQKLLHQKWKFIATEELDEWEQSRKRHTKQRKKDNSNISALPTGRHGFYGCVLSKMREVQEGNRYTSLVALGTVAYKCRIPKEDLIKHMESVVNHWNDRDQDQIERSEISKAMRIYNKKAQYTKSETLEIWMGIKFERKPRSVRTRKEHLAKVHSDRRSATLQRIVDYLKDHPTASNTQTAKDLNLSRPTIIKYRKAAEQIIKEKSSETQDNRECKIKCVSYR